jgi:hypothetical protein
MREAFGAPTTETRPGGQPDALDALRTAGTQDAEAPEFEEPSLSVYEKTKQTLSAFGERAKTIFGTMSEGGKAIASQMYDGIYALPGVQRIAGKMEIAGNQFFMDRHENKAISLRGRAEALGPQIEATDLAAKEITAAIETLRSMGAPGLAGLERKVHELDQKKLDLTLSRETFNQSAAARTSRMEQFRGKRDLIADRLIGIYEEKMSPLENRIDSLDNNLELAETQAEFTRTKFEEALGKLATIEEHRNATAKLLGTAGLNEKEVSKHEAVRLLDSHITAEREKIRVADEEIKRKLLGLNSSIAGSVAKVNGYRTKQQEFANLKRSTLNREEMNTQSQPVQQAPEGYSPADNTSEDMLGAYESEAANEEGSVEETVERISDYLEDTPNSNYTKEKKQEQLKAFLEADPDFLELFQNMFDEDVTDKERERFVEIFNKTRYSLPKDQKGFDICLPGNDKTKLIIERTIDSKVSTRILKQTT